MIVADKFAHNLSLSFVVHDNLQDSGNINIKFLYGISNLVWSMVNHGKRQYWFCLEFGMKFELRTTLNLWRVDE